MIEACQYYEIDFDKQDYRLHGWWNQNPAIKSENYISEGAEQRVYLKDGKLVYKLKLKHMTPLFTEKQKMKGIWIALIPPIFLIN